VRGGIHPDADSASHVRTLEPRHSHNRLEPFDSLGPVDGQKALPASAWSTIAETEVYC
jgi:hypothetical protein